MKKIKDKIEYIPVEAQESYSCEHDCVSYTNTTPVGTPPSPAGSAIYACTCSSKKITSASGWSAW